jgi:hypothetical protein
MSNKKPKQLRQGDVFLKRIDENELPVDLKFEAQQEVVLAEGEVTGHFHRVSNVLDSAVIDHPDLPQVAIPEDGEEGEKYLKVGSDAGAKLIHDEHDTVDLPKGTYKVTRQREYVPEGQRMVSD